MACLSGKRKRMYQDGAEKARLDAHVFDGGRRLLGHCVACWTCPVRPLALLNGNYGAGAPQECRLLEPKAGYWCRCPRSWSGWMHTFGAVDQPPEPPFRAVGTIAAECCDHLRRCTGLQLFLAGCAGGSPQTGPLLSCSRLAYNSIMW